MYSSEDGFTSFSFTRPRNSGDNRDIALDQCRYFLFAWSGPVDTVTRVAGYHGPNNRIPSSEEICLPSATQCPGNIEWITDTKQFVLIKLWAPMYAVHVYHLSRAKQWTPLMWMDTTGTASMYLRHPYIGAFLISFHAIATCIGVFSTTCLGLWSAMGTWEGSQSLFRHYSK